MSRKRRATPRIVPQSPEAVSVCPNFPHGTLGRLDPVSTGPGRESGPSDVQFTHRLMVANEADLRDSGRSDPWTLVVSPAALPSGAAGGGGEGGGGVWEEEFDRRTGVISSSLLLKNISFSLAFQRCFLIV